MRSIPLAMMWEMLSGGRWKLLTTFLGGNIMPMLLLVMLRRAGVERDDPSLLKLYLPFMLVNIFVFAGGAFASMGHPSRLATYPVSNGTLAAWHLIPMMLITVAEIVLSMGILQWGFELDLPIWSTAVFAAVVLSTVQATLWLTEKTDWMPFAMAAVSCALGFWYFNRFNSLSVSSQHGWVGLSQWEIGISLLIVIISWSVGTIAIGRSRRGEQLPPLGLTGVIEPLLDFEYRLPSRFRSRTDAYRWSEWTKKGWALPFTVVFGLGTGLALWGIFNRDPASLIEGLAGGGVILSVVGLIVGLFYGNLADFDSDFSMGTFLASRPLTNQEIASEVLRVTAKSVLMAWTIWALVLLGVCLCQQGLGLNPEFQLPPFIRWWYFPLTLISCWTTVAVTAMICLTGRIRFFAQVICTLFCGYLIVIIISANLGSREAQQRFLEVALALVSLMAGIGSIALLVAAHQYQLMHWRTIAVCGATSCMIWWIALMTVPQHGFVPVSTWVSLAGFVFLPWAPVAGAPLAVAWNRCR